jgi:hypothetical protein
MLAVGSYFWLSYATGVYTVQVPAISNLIAHAPMGAGAEASDAAGRFGWVISETTLCVALLFVVLFCIACWVKIPSRSLAFGFVGVSIAVATLGWFFSSHLELDYGGPTGRALVGRLYTPGTGSRIARTLLATNILTILVADLVGFTMSLPLVKGLQREDLEAWPRRLDHLLFMNAAVLATGVIEVAALYSWCLAPFPTTANLMQRSTIMSNGVKAGHAAYGPTELDTASIDNSEAVDDLRRWVRATTITTGLGFSLLLSSLYGTSKICLRYRTRIFSAFDSGPNISDRIVQFFAVLSPLLVGVLSTLTGLFGGSG